jgi:hypothetical protein
MVMISLTCSELSSGIYCPVKWLSTDVSEVHTASIIRDDTHPWWWGSTHLWHVGRQSFYMAVYPRRQLWTSYSPPWELEISHSLTWFDVINKHRNVSVFWWMFGVLRECDGNHTDLKCLMKCLYVRPTKHIMHEECLSISAQICCTIIHKTPNTI